MGVAGVPVDRECAVAVGRHHQSAGCHHGMTDWTFSPRLIVHGIFILSSAYPCVFRSSVRLSVHQSSVVKNNSEVESLIVYSNNVHVVVFSNILINVIIEVKKKKK